MRRVVWPLFAFVIIGNFAGYAIAGDNGLMAWGGYYRALEEREAELAALEAQRDALRHRSELLDPRAADPDMAEELVRRDLGLIREDEIIITLD
ncbi:FtsB family cell division protein [Sphingomicrobium astaxanthinifaciens]|uniref:FtsB family cell division protein n=1 Tax=Sphingomicrobium astaxanthinifaciens TaxID=1227949 RepID=UPI001FCAB6E2|nr:septum formation initiator family protein [Sphingomicrobium astaxanthinifaciens]MCJ7422335.1 septum formation initiator family protein [Sphingomicrobium astaxanthinifaciens]